MYLFYYYKCIVDDKKDKRSEGRHLFTRKRATVIMSLLLLRIAHCYAMAHRLQEAYANLSHAPHICIDQVTESALLPARFNATLRQATQDCLACSRNATDYASCQPILELQHDLHRIATRPHAVCEDLQTNRYGLLLLVTSER